MLARGLSAGLIIKSLTGLRADMEIACVVEGVETRAQIDSLRRLGCDLIQGYYFAKPMPMGALSDYLIQERARLGADTSEATTALA